MTAQPPFDSTDSPELWEALARYLSGESPAAEAQQVLDWLAQDPRRQQLLDVLARSLDDVAYQPPPDLDVEAALHRVTDRLQEAAAAPADTDAQLEVERAAPHDVVPIRSRTRERPVLFRSTTIVRVAAAIALLLGGALLYRAVQDRQPAVATAAAATYRTQVGQMDSLRLPDGTRVVLAPGSELRVPAGYGATSRTVALTGEALFDVIHHVERPFTVRAGAAVILDLGTTFSVRSRETDEVRVVVTVGSVLLRAEAAADSGVILRAGDRGVLAGDGTTLAQRAVVSEDDVAWTTGRLVFRDAPIDDVAAELRRWYGIELRVADPALAQRHVTATFAGEDVQQVLAVLELVLGARIERRGDTAVIRNPDRR